MILALRDRTSGGLNYNSSYHDAKEMYFRYVVRYIHRGVYMDLDSFIDIPLNQVINHKLYYKRMIMTDIILNL